LVTRIGPGRPAGELLRRYCSRRRWSRNSPAPPRESGAAARAGLRAVSRRAGPLRDAPSCRDCPHRGAGPRLRRLEDGGLRCPFHGWLFDVHWRCLETPAERKAAGCAGGSAARLSGRERNGILFAYLGPLGADGQPPAFRAGLLRRAVQPHLRLQGADRVQLAAGARGRHRSRPPSLPAPLPSRTRTRARPTGASFAPPPRTRRFR